MTPTTSTHYNNATTNVVDYQSGQRMRLKGKLLEIKNEKIISLAEPNTRLIVEFILEVAHINTQNPHHYHIKAFSDSDTDRFKIKDFVGQPVECCCYLNGRAVVIPGKGTWHTNELCLHSIN